MKKYVLILAVGFFGLMLSNSQMSAMQSQKSDLQKVSWAESMLQRIQYGAAKASQKTFSVLNNVFQKLSFQNLSPVQKTIAVLSCLVLVEYMVAGHVGGDSMSYNAVVSEDEDMYWGHGDSNKLAIFNEIAHFVEQGVGFCRDRASENLQDTEEKVFEDCLNKFVSQALQYCQSYSILTEECKQIIPMIMLKNSLDRLIEQINSMFS